MGGSKSEMNNTSHMCFAVETNHMKEEPMGGWEEERGQQSTSDMCEFKQSVLVWALRPPQSHPVVLKTNSFMVSKKRREKKAPQYNV